MRLVFCRFIQQQIIHKLNFHKKNSFTDEACFTRSGIINIYNKRVYTEENPHAVKVKYYQHEFCINICLEIIDNNIIVPVILLDRSNDKFICNFCETLPEFLENVSLLLTFGLWVYAWWRSTTCTVNFRQYLNQRFPRHWVNRGNYFPVNWYVRSLDLTPCGYYLWGTVKTAVYASAPNSEG